MARDILRSMKRILPFLMCMACAAVLSGCGNKGPLVLPARPPVLEQPAPMPAEPVEPAAADTEAVDSGAAADGVTEPGR